MELGAWSLELGACGLAPDHAMHSGSTVSEALSNDASLQALHLVEVQDPVNSILI